MATGATHNKCICATSTFFAVARKAPSTPSLESVTVTVAETVFVAHAGMTKNESAESSLIGPGFVVFVDLQPDRRRLHHDR
jgi:hypothetical protein